MEDPFQPRDNRRRTSEDLRNMVAMFTVGQPPAPQTPVTRSAAGRALHGAAIEAQVIGTVYEQSTKLWKRNCTYDIKMSLRLSIHGPMMKVLRFMELMEETQPELYARMEGGFKLRSVAELGGMPGDIMLPKKPIKATRFGVRAKKSTK